MIRSFLPETVNRRLFGDRQRFGKRAWKDDPDWQKWLESYPEANKATQRAGGLQARINDAGYRVLAGVDLDGKTVAEIGPGGGHHLDFFRGRPDRYTAIDVSHSFLDKLAPLVSRRGIAYEGARVAAYEGRIPVASNTQDVVMSFYSLEHLHPLNEWLDELFRILRPGGVLVGAIPTEGGIVWALGRYMTSRLTLSRQFGLEIEKILCWEHPNMCDDVLHALHLRGRTRTFRWPIRYAPLDINLIIRFVVQKDDARGHASAPGPSEAQLWTKRT